METITGIHNCQNTENNWTQGSPSQLIHLQAYTEGSGRITGVGGGKILIARGPRYLSSWRSYLLHDWEAVLTKSQVIKTRLAEWQHQLTSQHEWRKCHSALSPDKELQAIDGFQEGANQSSPGTALHPRLPKPKYSAQYSCTYKQHQLDSIIKEKEVMNLTGRGHERILRRER